MDWPARSLDLNPIEHVWDALVRRIGARHPSPRTLVELRTALLEEWGLLPVDLFQSLECQAIREAIFLSIPITLGFSVLTDCVKIERRILEDSMNRQSVKPLCGHESSGICCSNGKDSLPLIDLPPEPLRSLLSRGNSDSVHVLRQVYHRVGSLLPSENQPSRFLHIYFMGVDDYDKFQTKDVSKYREYVVILYRVCSNICITARDNFIEQQLRGCILLNGRFPLPICPTQIDTVICAEFQILFKTHYCKTLRRASEAGGFTAKVKIRENKEVTIKNRWVVPHSPLLSKMFCAHINGENCCSVKTIKYIA
ncbi:hypothetical protein LAZ67_5002307 [Cordylochernes scorpioides]|uniref:Uncharacterized protein n=1 Tax=Cordylochernes scorpioides TaxID=51811 RepID=A0ABY6KH06_9ARAC|nr:hypothetical protein LAZ67_5002307 [Cordylochernes scorpioides]